MVFILHCNPGVSRPDRVFFRGRAGILTAGPNGHNRLNTLHRAVLFRRPGHAVITVQGDGNHRGVAAAFLIECHGEVIGVAERVGGGNGAVGMDGEHLRVFGFIPQRQAHWTARHHITAPLVAFKRAGPDVEHGGEIGVGRVLHQEANESAAGVLIGFVEASAQHDAAEHPHEIIDQIIQMGFVLPVKQLDILHQIPQNG